MKTSHEPVLLNEVVDALNLHPDAFVIDGTVDGGGHAEKILERISPQGKLLGLDLDPELLSDCRERLRKFPNVILRQGNYANLPEVLAAEKLPKADALLLDLGFSSGQLDGSGRGFAFNADEPLTMTYSPEAEPAFQVLARMREKEIAEMIKELGEERYAIKIARAIYSRERRAIIRTTGELAETIRSAAPGNYEHGRLNPATRTFQALRIYVNDELGNLRRLLGNLPAILAPGGRAAIISFHSLEDRIVKHSFRDMAKAGILRVLTKKPVEAGEEETAFNPRARSAKLRAAQLL